LRVEELRRGIADEAELLGGQRDVLRRLPVRVVLDEAVLLLGQRLLLTRQLIDLVRGVGDEDVQQQHGHECGHEDRHAHERERQARFRQFELQQRQLRPVQAAGLLIPARAFGEVGLTGGRLGIPHDRASLIFCTARRRTLAARGLFSASFASAISAPRMISVSHGWCSSGTTGISGGAEEVVAARKVFFTIVSSSDWWDSITATPPTCSALRAAGRAVRSTPSSSLTS